MKFNNKEFQIKRLGVQDVSILKRLLHLFQEIFEMEKPVITNESYLQKLLGKTDFIAYVVICENEIAGGLTAYELPMYYSEYSEVFIYDIAISPEFQRKGLGRKLLSTLKEYCRQNGIREIFVAANEEDAHAVNFYKSTGGRAERVVHFNYEADK
ncbi:MAG TPA: GNAT family N-acetyltransferase [Cytophagaceae bacterium]|jgi:aminoglycoside 3-N-acetyltransferase I|nr:GNAT family N-acetyltransferase [Cytophagaceae bacterium]